MRRIVIAKALIFNERNEALVLTISEHKKRPERSFTPDLPRGTADSSEDMLSTLIREVREETSIEIAQSEAEFFQSDDQLIEETILVTKHLFIVRLTTTPTVVLSWEHSRYEWVDIASLGDVKFSSFYSEAVKAFTRSMLN